MKEKYLSHEKVCSDDIYLSSSFSGEKILTIDPSGNINLEKRGQGYDQKWKLIPNENGEGYYLSSSKNNQFVCHNMKDHGDINIKTFEELNKDQQNGCIWKIGKSGELYQDNPKGGERYLWVANDKLFVTLDGFLAESWIPLSENDEYLEKEENTFTLTEDETHFSFPKVLFFILTLVMISILIYIIIKLLK